MPRRYSSAEEAPLGDVQTPKRGKGLGIGALGPSGVIRTSRIPHPGGGGKGRRCLEDRGSDHWHVRPNYADLAPARRQLDCVQVGVFVVEKGGEAVYYFLNGPRPGAPERDGGCMLLPAEPLVSEAPYVLEQCDVGIRAGGLKEHGGEVL